MTHETYRPGLDKYYHVTRRIRLDYIGHDHVDAILKAMSNVPCVIRVFVNADTLTLDMVFDASCSETVLEQVEHILAQNGCDLSSRIWTLFRENWYVRSDLPG